MPVMPQPHDARHVEAARLLGLTLEEVTVRCALIGADMIYAWDAPRGRSALVNAALYAREFEPGVLLQEALAAFKKGS